MIRGRKLWIMIAEVKRSIMALKESCRRQVWRDQKGQSMR